MLYCPACRKDGIPDSERICPLCAGPLLIDGRSLRDAGMALVRANASEEWKDAVRSIVIRLAQQLDMLTIEDVRRACIERGVGEPHHPNAWGTVLRSAGLEPTGTYVTNRSPKAHARRVMLWRSPLRPSLGAPTPVICCECGNAEAADGQSRCTDCLVAMERRLNRGAEEIGRDIATSTERFLFDQLDKQDRIDPTQEGRSPSGRRTR